MKIKTIQTGSTIVSPAVPDRSTRKSSLAYTGLFQNRGSRITVPVKCYYVSIANHHILIDAGWSREVVDRPLKHLGPGLYFASVPVMKDGEAAVQQLTNEPIDSILMTHLDCDHVSGLHDFGRGENFGRREIPAFASREEIKASGAQGVFNIRYGMLAKGLDIQALGFSYDIDAPFEMASDVFGDGSVIAYLTPTHSAGSVIYKIVDDEKFALVVGDNGYSERSWKEGLLPGPLYNAENMKHALDWINKQSEKEECVGVFCAHDPVDRNYEIVE